MEQERAPNTNVPASEEFNPLFDRACVLGEGGRAVPPWLWGGSGEAAAAYGRRRPAGS